MKKAILLMYSAAMVWVVVLVVATIYRVFIAENITPEELKGNLGVIAFGVLILMARYSGRLLK